MRSSLITTIIFIIVLIFLTDPSTAQIGGSVETNTTLTTPASIVSGDSITVTSSSTFTGGPVFIGHNTIYHLDDIRIEGDTDFGTDLIVNDPVYQFFVSSDLTLRVLKIPIISFTTDSVLHWNLSDSNDILLADGEIGSGNLVQMEQDRNILIVIGSIQSDDPDNFNKFSSGIQLTSGSYKVSLYQNDVLTVTSKASSSYQGVYAYENEVLQSTYPQIYLLGGSHRERSNTVNGQVGSTFIVSSGISYVLAYYGDNTSSFQPSYDFVKISAASVSPLSVVIGNYQGSPGSSLTISAEVFDSGTPVSGSTIQFSFLSHDILISIGSTSTNAAGYAQIFYSANLDPGNYSIYAEANYLLQYGLANSSLSLTQPIATWYNLQATADYGSGGLGNSISTISGTIKTQGGNPIVDADVSIWKDGSVLVGIKSDSNGDFNYSHLVNVAVGSYSTYYDVNITNGFWDGNPQSLDLIVSKGQLLVETNDVNMEFIDQPASIVGNITNEMAESIVSSIYLDWETSPGTWITVDSIISSTFNFPLQSHSAGSYNYRIRVDESVNWVSVIEPITVSIGQSNAAINRNPLPTTFDIYFHQNYDFSAYVLQDNLLPVEGARVQVSVYHPILNDFIIAVEGFSDSNGLVSLFWMPDDGFLALPGQQFIASYTATHSDFVISGMNTYFTLISIDINVSLLENSWVYDTSNTIVFNTTDQFGFPAIEGTQFDILIEGIPYTITTDANGQGRITHTFSNVGSATVNVLSVDPSPAPYFPYNQYSDTIAYTINKGEYIILGSNENSGRGQTHQFSAIITDHNDDPLANPATVSLWLFDVTWIKVGEKTEVSNFNFPVDIILNEGTYIIEWRIAGNSLYNDSSQAYILTVEKSATEIEFTQVPSSYNFNDIVVNREVVLLIRVPLLNEPVANHFVTIDYVSNTDSYSWFLQTDASGIITFNLPQQPKTGNYLLTVTLAADNEYLATISDTPITVIGIDTILTWSTLPLDGYYAENQYISLHAQDILGNDLDDFTVSLSVGTDNFSVQSNSTGDATFTLNMRYEGTVNIVVVLQPKDGWNGQSTNTTVTIEKKQLQLSSEINTVRYSPTNNLQDIDISMLVSSNNDEYLSNIKLELYWLNPSTSTFEFVGIYYSDNDGFVNITLTFPSINASQSYYFSWTASDADFLTEIFNQSYALTPMPLNTEIQYNTGYFMQATAVDFTVRDINGRLLDDLNIYMSYTEIILLWSDTDTTAFGTAGLQFIAPSVGNLAVFYIVSDSNNNYISEEGTIIITINPSQPSITHSLVDNQGTVTLIIDVRDQSNAAITDGTVSIERWQGTWIVENTISLTQTNSINLRIYAESMEFRIRYIQNSHYYDSELNFHLYKQDLNVISDPFLMEINDGLPIYLEITGNTTLDGYLVEIYILDPNTVQWINYGSLYTVGGTINETLPINYGMGNYQLRIVIPDQGWYREFNQTYELEISFNHFFFALDNNEYVNGIPNSIEVRINTSAPDAITNVQLDLYIEIDATRIHLGMAFTDSNGLASFTFTPTQQNGFYQFVIESTQTALVEVTSHTFTGTIGYNLFAEFSIEDPLDYDQGGIVAVRLIDHMGLPIINSQVDVFYSLFDTISQSYLTPQYFSTFNTNTTGYVQIVIPANIFTNDLLRISISLTDQYVIGDSLFSYEINIRQITPTIGFSVNDNGVSQYAAITIIVINSLDEPIGGEISWTLKSGTQIIILEGSGTLAQINNVYQYDLLIEAIYIGEYQLIIDYHDSSLLNKYLDTSKIGDLGWTKTTGKIDLLTPLITYNASQEIKILISDSLDFHPLANIPITLVINDVEYFSSTDHLGIGIFDILLVPGSYNIEFMITNSILVESISVAFDMEISKGTLPLFLSEPSNYSSIPTGIEMNISDPLIDDSLLDEYGVIIYRDGMLVKDVNWTINDVGVVFLYPVYSKLHALSTENNHLNHLYPGNYAVEISRTHPYYENITYTREFVVRPLTVEFRHEFVNVNGSDYLMIYYDNTTSIDVEFTVLLRNTELREERIYENEDQILIPWNQGIVTVLIEGKGYVSVRRTGHHEIQTTNLPTNSSSNNKSTVPDNGFGLDNLINVNSIQAVGGIIILGSASITPVKQYLKRRK